MLDGVLDAMAKLVAVVEFTVVLSVLMSLSLFHRDRRNIRLIAYTSKANRSFKFHCHLRKLLNILPEVVVEVFVMVDGVVDALAKVVAVVRFTVVLSVLISLSICHRDGISI